MTDWHEAGCARDCTEQHTYTLGRCALSTDTPPPPKTLVAHVKRDMGDGYPGIVLSEADDAPAYGCTINGVPAMPILVAEYNQMVTDLAQARGILANIHRLATEYPAGIDTALIDEALDTQPGQHVYLSTGCFHGDHDYCKAMTGFNGAKRSASCKKCGAKCICGCHGAEETATPADCPASTTDACIAAAQGGDVCAVQDGVCVHDEPEPTATDRTTRLDTLARDILNCFVPTRDSTGMHVTHHQAVVRPHEMRAWQDALDDTQEE